MAVIEWARDTSYQGAAGFVVLECGPVTSADTVAELDLSTNRDAIIDLEVEGTFDGATVTMQGGNASGVAATLKDTSGANMAFTATGGGIAGRQPLFVNAGISGAGGSTSLTLRAVVR